jgi:hypothetical protein
LTGSGASAGVLEETMERHCEFVLLPMLSHKELKVEWKNCFLHPWRRKRIADLVICRRGKVYVVIRRDKFT